MKKFIIRTIIGGAIVLCCAIALDVVITRGLKQVDDFIYEPWTYIQKGNHQHDVVILGNSRAQGHIHPMILDSICGCNSYNLGIEAYHMNMHLLKYDYYLQYNPKPKLIVYQVDLATIHRHPIKRGSNSEQFLPLFYESYWRERFIDLGYNQLDLYCPLYRYFGYHSAIRCGIMEGLGLKHFELNQACKGFKGWNEDMVFSNVQVEIEQINEVNRYSKNKEDFEVFETFIQQCKTNDIEIVLVYSPMYEPVEKQLIDRELFETYMHEVADKYNVVCLDYTKDLEFCSNKSYFSSPGHLNLLGAEVFTTKLSHDIDSLGLLK